MVIVVMLLFVLRKDVFHGFATSKYWWFTDWSVNTAIVRKWKWRESDIRPSMVTYTQNSCSAFNPSKVHTHSSEYTHREHAPGIHNRSSGQPMLRHPGKSSGFGALLKSISVVVLRVERALYIHSPHLQFLPAWDSNLQPLDYKSDSKN